ncbi:MAG: zinc-ribbon domain-containing protein [Thermodesulfobacteriota bacterium]|jgi:hypothetical protein
MICNRCGQENPDDAMSCAACGHKLQSGWKGRGEGEAPGGEPLPRLGEPGPAARRRLKRHAEAWAVAALVWAASYGLLAWGHAWALYPLAALAGGYALLRGITWKD